MERLIIGHLVITIVFNMVITAVTNTWYQKEYNKLPLTVKGRGIIVPKRPNVLKVFLCSFFWFVSVICVIIFVIKDVIKSIRSNHIWKKEIKENSANTENKLKSD